MAANEFSCRLHDAIENYYQYNPDTLMPLLMLALATRGHLIITTKEKKGAYLACSLHLDEIKNYDWVQLNEKLNEKVESLLNEGGQYLNVEMDLGRSLYPIYQTIHRNDTKDVVEEHHHRIGRLVQHSCRMASEKAQRQYATYILADAMIACPVEDLKKEYLYTFNHILEKSGLQPERPRMNVARTLSALLGYNGNGLVYNPFAGSSLAGAMLQSVQNYYGDGDSNDKVYAAGLLLNYGMGVSNEHFIQRDSTLWLEGKKIDYVLSTYTGYIQDHSAFDFCLGKCLADEQFTGRYAGMVAPREIFENMTGNFKEALNRDWIDTLVVLPFGEVAVLVDANRENKGLIKLIDCNNPLARHTDIEEIVEQCDMYADFILAEDAKRENFLKDFIRPALPEREGRKKVRLGELVSRIPRKVYDLKHVDEDERVLAYIDRRETWQGGRWDENIKRREISNLFGPAYYLDDDCLIVNSAGKAEPRLFCAYNGNAFFEDGYAFSLDNLEDPDALARELSETYVYRQLHPYGNNEMVPEPLTEDDYLNVVLYIDIPGYADEKAKKTEIERKNWFRKDAEDHALPAGSVVKDGKTEYNIISFISNGAFGYTYRAEMHNIANGTREIVALKEYFPRQYLNCQGCTHENGRVVCDAAYQSYFQNGMALFKHESEFIQTLNATPGHHVTELKSSFESKEAGTMFYAMKYYSGLTLEDMIRSDQVPSSEKLVTEKIVIPLCKALYAMHSHMILHLDINPKNVVIDENGEAVLIDFGLARQYDAEGRLVSTHELGANSEYSAPEYKGGMKYFSPPADIYGLAATLHKLLEKESAQDDWSAPPLNCSAEMQQAIDEGMSEYVNDRPMDALQFLRNFPGCRDIKL